MSAGHSHPSTTGRPHHHLRSRPCSGVGNGNHALATARPIILAAARLLLLPLASAAPLHLFGQSAVHSWEADEDLPKDANDPGLWLYLGIAIALVLIGGIFAGLTIALMGQDETYLQVIATSGEGSEKRHATKVLGLLNRGKHWVLVTLLLSNVITNETLPIVLDRSLGGGWPAVVSSTVLIVIFGEIVPQSICVRFGLSIGAYMSPMVLGMMWAMAPVAWPTAKLLDYLLGEDHGTMYKKAGLKTLVTLHKTLGAGAGEQLMEDEVTIINSVLDLKDKPVGDIMTPMQDVFTMSADTILDERMMDIILSQGYSRIPIYAPDNPRNFIGMLLVKILITYDPEDAMRVRDFALATLPETAPYTSCLDIINFFQEGKSHMVLVSDFPGQDKGALGVVTLEDVIEELIGEEIIDESDVFIDIHKAIRRMAPAPKTRFRAHHDRSALDDDDKDADETQPLLGKKDGDDSRKPSLANGQTTFMMRRKGSTASDHTRDKTRPVPIRSTPTDLKEHLKHLGPSNAANHPKATKFTSVKIKPGIGTIPEHKQTTTGIDADSGKPAENSTAAPAPAVDIDDAVEALRSGRPRGASGGAAAVYGTMNSTPTGRSSSPDASQVSAQEASRLASQHTAASQESPKPQSALGRDAQQQSQADNGIGDRWFGKGDTNADDKPLELPEKLVIGHKPEEDDLLGELGGSTSNDRSKKRLQARSGSITETTMEVRGMKKMVLETNSSSEDDDTASATASRQGSDAIPNGLQQNQESANDNGDNGDGGKKKRKKRGKKKKGNSGD